MENLEFPLSVTSTQPPLPEALLQKFCSQNQLDFEIEFYEALLRRQPYFVEALRVLGNNLTAKGDYHRSLDVDRQIIRLCPSDGVAHYNLACSYSLLGMIDPALASLRMALECGYDEFDYLREDRDLENLRKDPRFLDLLLSHGVLT